MPQTADFPEVDPARAAEIINEAMDATTRMLIIAGVEPDVAEKKVAQLRPRYGIVPRGAGPELRVQMLRGGGHASRSALSAFVTEVQEEIQLESFGPDPVALLTERLIACGLSREDAERRAARRIRRLEDGEMEFSVPGGFPMKSDNNPDSALHRDRFVAYAARRIIGEVDREPRTVPAETLAARRADYTL